MQEETAMQAKREKVCTPIWMSDQLDSPVPSFIEPPYFDTTLNAWVLSRHEDVLAAFRSSSLDVDSRELRTPEDESTRLTMREETLRALSPAQVRTWLEG